VTSSVTNKAAHTPGPWQVAGQFDDRTFVASQGKNADCICKCDVGNTGLPHAANARLIAAAPQLLAALYDAEAYFDNHADVVDGDYGEPAPNKAMTMLATIRAALAIATGERP
jgi:hypothetical protein